MRIQPIVEGHGDVDAVPVLLRRLVVALGRPDVRIGRPIRVPRSRLPRNRSHQAAIAELERATRLATAKVEGAGAILLLVDADEDCPAQLGPLWRAIMMSPGASVPVYAVLAKREFEAWFLGAMESLRGIRGVRPDAMVPADPEGISGAKEFLQRQMSSGRYYSETVDQAALSARFDINVARRRCPSFDKLYRDLTDFVHQLGEVDEP